VAKQSVTIDTRADAPAMIERAPIVEAMTAVTVDGAFWSWPAIPSVSTAKDA
jgi:hypothetical protein